MIFAHKSAQESLSADYTLHNHLQQSADHYAVAKYEIVRRWLSDYARPGMTLLNIGCGAGYFNRIAHGMGLRVIACEPDPIAFDLAQKDAPKDCIVYNCDLRTFASQGHTAPLAVCIEVLEHIEDDAAATAQIRSMLETGGHAIVSVPALQILYGSHDERLGHFRRYSARSLRALLSGNFRISRIRYYGAFSIPIVVAFSQLMRRDYPRQTGRQGLVGRAYGALCKFESRVALPVGTSLIADVTA